MKISAKKELKNGFKYAVVGGLAGSLAAQKKYISMPTKYALRIPQGESHITRITDSFIDYAKDNLDIRRIATFGNDKTKERILNRITRITIKEAKDLLPAERKFYQDIYDIGNQYLTGKRQVNDKLLTAARESARVVKGAIKKEKFDFMKNYIVKGAIGALVIGEAIALGVKFFKEHSDFFEKFPLKKNSKLTQKNV